MRIALYVHCFFPGHFYGTEAYTLALAKELIGLGHEPVVVSATFAGEPRQANIIEESSYEGVRVVSIDKNAFPNRSVRDTYEQPALRHLHERLLRKLQPDVIHICHLISHTTAALDAARRMMIPAFATLTDFFGFCYNNRLENAQGGLCEGPDPARANCIECFLKAVVSRSAPPFLARLGGHPTLRPFVSRGLARFGEREADPFIISSFAPNDIIVRPRILHAAMEVYREAIAPTLFLKRAYERNGFPAPMRVSHFGVDIDRAPKPPRPEGADVRLGFIGQLVPHKGAHLLLDAMRACGRANLSLAIWGPQDQDPAYYAGLRRQAEGLPVKFCGALRRTELAGAFAVLDYLVIPSTWYENSPLILLQALATHTPVIISDVLGMTEFVADGVNGFHFRRGDRDSLAALLLKVADDPELALRMSAAAAYERRPADMARDLLGMYAEHDLVAFDPPRSAIGPADRGGAGPIPEGVEGPLVAWLAQNDIPTGASEAAQGAVAPFPPAVLMRETSGLQRPADFARHGVDIMRALSAVSPEPLNSYRSWLDFGVGAGRLARLFKGYQGSYVGLDVDARMIEWARSNLPWVHAVRTVPRQPLPCADARFDAIVSVSVFTHMTESDLQFYSAEFHRVAQPGAVLMITLHGRRALERASADPAVLDLLGVPTEAIERARAALDQGPGFLFIRQAGHLTSSEYDYGVTFVGWKWIDSVWTKWFDIVAYAEGAIHDFQDIVVLRRR